MIDEPSLIKKKKFEIKSMKNVIVIALILIVSVVGVSYAFFDYYKINNNQLELIAGEMYLNLVDGSSDLRLETAFPQTVSEARSRTDNVITFDITGKNTSENKIIWYEIMLNEGIEEAGKTRFKPEHLLFDLVEIIDGNERMVVNAVSYDEFNKTRIWVNTVDSNTDKEITITYKLRMWLSEDVIISDTESYADYTTDVYRNSYASVKVEVYGDFKEKKVVTLASTLETSLADNLTEPDVDGTRYVNGEVDNNYVWYSGKMWRVVALNADGTVKLVTQNAMTSIAWSTDSANTNYTTSQIRSWLNTEFLPTINEDLIVESNWDYTTYASFPTTKLSTISIVTDKVGLLSVYDYKMTGGTTDRSTSKAFLNNGYSWWTMSTYTDGSDVWNVSGNAYIYHVNLIDNYYGVRPSVNLKSDITLAKEGTGEIETPYMLEGDTEVGQTNELLSSRLSGEYIKFNNVRYRIVGLENGLTKITMADYSVNKNTLSSVTFGASSDELTFSTTYSIGKYLNEWYNATSENDTSGTYTGLYLNKTYKDMIATPNDGVRWYAGPDAGTGYDYTKAKEGTAIVATIGLGRYGEMFSSQFGEGYSSSDFLWLITKHSSSDIWYVGDFGYTHYYIPNSIRCARPSFYLKSNVKIESGSGLPNDPYEIYQETLAYTFSTKLANNLTEPDVDGTRYVTGETVDNNYVWYSGKMWRIVALNADETVKLVTQSNMSTLTWNVNAGDSNYSNSQIRNWLNNEFLPTLYNSDNLVKTSVWDYTTDNTADLTKPVMSSSVSEKVGMLTNYDYMMTGGTDNADTSKTFLTNGDYWWLMTPQVDDTGVWRVEGTNLPTYNCNTNWGGGVRPAINLRANVVILRGTGTLNDPYTIQNDKSVAQENELLNQRVSGEFIKFNNVLYRVVGFENGLTKVTMADYSVNNNSLTNMAFGGTSTDYDFDTSRGIGKYLYDWYNGTSIVTKYKSMIATDGITWYTGETTDDLRDYTLSKTGKIVSSPIGLGYYGELFSSHLRLKNDITPKKIWLITKFNNEAYLWTVMSSGDGGGTIFNNDTVAVRPSFYLKSNVRIASGSGMPHDAYTISQ